jgi:hypothetical protein
VTERVVAVLVRRTTLIDAPLAEAMLEDVVDLVAGMPQVAAALLIEPGAQEVADRLSWPGMPHVAAAADAGVGQLLEAVATLADDAVAVVVGDVPDLPPLLLGKLFSALAGPPRRTLALCPAAGGGLVAVAAAVPLRGEWLSTCDVRFDDADAASRLRTLAPPRELAVGPGWHRIRALEDTGLLDPALEGWETTRSVLG